MNNLEVWKPKIRVPKMFMKNVHELREFKSPEFFKSSRKEGIPNLRTWSGVDVISADGYCLWHHDKFVSEGWSCLIVIRNDPSSWLEVKGSPVIKEQPVGTAILFNAHKMHRLNCVKGRFGEPGIFSCLLFDCKEYRTPKEWESVVKAALRKIKDDTAKVS